MDTSTKCTAAEHAAAKADPIRWNALVLVGVQTDDDDVTYRLELRNCACGSTLGKKV